MGSNDDTRTPEDVAAVLRRLDLARASDPPIWIRPFAQAETREADAVRGALVRLLVLSTQLDADDRAALATIEALDVSIPLER